MEASLASGTEVPNPCCGHCLASAPPGVAFRYFLVHAHWSICVGGGVACRHPGFTGVSRGKQARKAFVLFLLFPAVTQQAMRDKKSSRFRNEECPPFVVSRHAF
ncbi:hypothetical protein CEXT_478821 [Caerostris extrusa]|uniref:Uncharacterized protein n=1 Tax=Caerostris extrusa TaxID=172846 RepID=A0AAV4TWM9_CAEEX|nr:hypothetical protein CEXT_478821 [Caerostris extrusa]